MKRLADHLPLKQGLRPASPESVASTRRNARRPSSIKTRIKTNNVGSSHILSPARRPSSIKTRIKTHNTFDYSISLFLLADHLPLKQGLRRHPLKELTHQIKALADHLPLKQGLRLLLWKRISYIASLSRRPSSIKTRIKTLTYLLPDNLSKSGDGVHTVSTCSQAIFHI